MPVYVHVDFDFEESYEKRLTAKTSKKSRWILPKKWGVYIMKKHYPKSKLDLFFFRNSERTVSMF